MTTLLIRKMLKFLHAKMFYLIPMLGIGGYAHAATTAELLQALKLPAGFSASIYASGLDNPRQMSIAPDGVLYVGSSGDKVYAITPDGKVNVVAQRLNCPNGVAWHNGDLYIGEISRISKIPTINPATATPYKTEPVSKTFPDDKWHGMKTIRFSPDGWLYVPVGAPCNVCLPSDKHALIARIQPDGSRYEVVARGVRNSVGLDFSPTDGSLWFTDNGRDMLGDDMPSCELNHVTQIGQHFGFPYCHQGDTPDPGLAGKRQCSEFIAPAAKLGAHVAPLGMRFYTGKQFPQTYQNSALIALHGSWNRSKKSGYKVVQVQINGKQVTGVSDFITGWLRDEKVSGRPVDVEIAKDGSVFVSDDQNGVIYRISYQK